jgi:hypothetical protein
MKRTLYIAAIMTISAAAFMPSVSMAQVDVNVFINSAPPAPRFESVPQARRGQLWAPGYWNWDGRRHDWSSGHWEDVREGQSYRPAEWRRDNGGWRLNRGGWQQLQQTDYQSQPVRYTEVRIAPPPPRYEREPRARRDHLWAAGHWEWRGSRHDWVPGTWIAQRPGYAYNQAAWIERDGRWYMEPGRWSRGRGDNDRDGIPNRFDKDRDNDGIPNRWDHDRDNDGRRDNRDRDRDGDGVPNRYDNRPNNPRRN